MSGACDHPNVGPDLSGVTTETEALLALATWEAGAQTEADPFAMPKCPDCGESVGAYLVRANP